MSVINQTQYKYHCFLLITVISIDQISVKYLVKYRSLIAVVIKLLNIYIYIFRCLQTDILCVYIFFYIIYTYLYYIFALYIYI